MRYIKLTGEDTFLVPEESASQVVPGRKQPEAAALETREARRRRRVILGLPAGDWCRKVYTTLNRGGGQNGKSKETPVN